MTYPFPNFDGAANEVGEEINNFIAHFIMDVIIYPANLGSKYSYLLFLAQICLLTNIDWQIILNLECIWFGSLGLGV